jgi:hypothetical protein
MSDPQFLPLREVAKRTQQSLTYWRKQSRTGNVPGLPRIEKGEGSEALVDLNLFLPWYNNECVRSVPYMPRGYNGERAIDRLWCWETHDRLLRRAQAGLEYVYFAACPRAVKIGYAVNVRSRVSTIASSSLDDICLLGVLRGGREVEADLHATYCDFRIRGEWFAMTPHLEAVIKECRQ